MSLDAYVAGPDGGVEFLDPFTGDYGYADFYADIDAVVMGRTSFDQVVGFDVPWPYAGRECHVVTSTDLPDDAPEGVSRWRGSLAEYAARMTRKLAWVVGGPRLQAGFLAEGLIERLDIFVMPVLLGRGVPLFPHSGGALPLNLENSEAFRDGVVRLRYSLGAA